MIAPQVMALPYAHFFASSILVFIRGKTSLARKYVPYYSLYCILDGDHTLDAIENAEHAVMMLGTILYEVRTALVCRKMTRAAENMDIKNDLGFSTFVRLSVFTIWLLIG
ncbi:hypothetical protein SISSUDRAFT_385838 [Sistotremastrum suecicum HHB10207 ss-3]|uniref:Uncharacterized protein n=1 Tax=Sistotremastrum suecicum HHB10207 ss-3 TaxID=1314776 RepID=A0A166FV44_9AGAM|nr:hypothetical protein SISSUDRAFT_385838 [Sistotremastrum suecicum HHB10207 ss-3]